MASNSDTVLAFLKLWEQPGGLDQSFRDYFTPGTIWENVGLATTTGIDEAIALNAQLGQSIGIATIRVDTLSIAEAGNKVLTERIDHLVDAAGRVIHSAPCMGAFDMDDGKITGWRDYFDSLGAMALQGGEHANTD